MPWAFSALGTLGVESTALKLRFNGEPERVSLSFSALCFRVSGEQSSIISVWTLANARIFSPTEVFQARGFAGSHDPTGHLSHPDPKKVGGFVGRPVEVMLHSSLHTRHVSVRGADIDGGKRHGFVQRHQRAFSPRAPACRR